MSESAAYDERIEALVAQALEAFDRGGEGALATALPAEPELAGRVRSIVARLTAFGLAGGEPAALPERIGGYRVVRELGRGGMGVVYEVADDALARRLALKVVRPELLAHTAARDRFDREIAAVARVQHAAIVPVIGSGSDGGVPFFVMPLVLGCSIETAVGRLLDREPAQPTGADLQAVLGDHSDLHGTFAGHYWQAAVRLLRQVALGIQFAHERGVVHRDLKPSNVLLTGDGRAIVVDFGLAQMRGSVRLTRSGDEPGSPLWMAPEQVRGEPADERTDVYGLGAALWFFIARATPFREADAASLPQRITQGLVEPLPRDVPPELRLVLATAMDRDRARRYSTAHAFAADLDAVLAGRAIAARPLPWSVRSLRLAQRHRAATGALSALLLALPLLLGMLWWREHDLGQQVSAQRDRADAKVREFDLLAAVVRHEQLLEQARQLHPSWPERLPALQSWHAEAMALLAMQPEIDRATERLRAAGETAAPAAQFLANTLGALSLSLTALRDSKLPEMEQRAHFAQQLREMGGEHPLAAATWPAVRAAIAAADDVVASARYRDQRIQLEDHTVVGLVPIGMNPVTKLWEFYDLRSAWEPGVDVRGIAIPRHRPDGTIPVDDATGIVFVLVPGATTVLGAQAIDPLQPLFDPFAEAYEEVHDQVLGPFLIARHELTQAQWARSSAADAVAPSHYKAGNTIVSPAVTGANPVEHVSWLMCEQLLRAHGMCLPSEAQWEYACRAGTTTPWWCGEQPESLIGVSNLLDRTAVAAIPQWGEGEAFDDGHVVHARVGTFPANAFGLHDVHGNVWEWCADTFGTFAEPSREGDGLRLSRTSTNRVARGGCFQRGAVSARCSSRFHWDPTMRDGSVGVRAARACGGDDRSIPRRH